MKREDCLLFSGGDAGAEAAFGAAAERYGVDEVNFTFEGHNPARQRGRRVLTNAELRRGDVSLGYVSKLMHRKYPDTPLFRKVLQSIWHQVNNGQQIFVIGAILQAMKTYGMYLADLGTDMYVQGEPSALWMSTTFSQVQSVDASNFEAVDLAPIMARPGWDVSSARVPPP